jgi:hypothetical protein
MYRALAGGELLAMKPLFVCTGLLLAAATLFAQTEPLPGMPPGPPKSPAAKETATIAGKTITIAYSSPRVRGRQGQIFTKDGLVGHEKNYPVWRAGANAATTLETSAEIEIGDLHLPAGLYTLYVDLSDPAQWLLIVNKKTGVWGLDYDPTQNLGKVKMLLAKPPALVEELKYTLTDTGQGQGLLTLAWENVSASVPIRAR